jgi:hypothetical protein
MRIVVFLLDSSFHCLNQLSREYYYRQQLCSTHHTQFRCCHRRMMSLQIKMNIKVNENLRDLDIKARRMLFSWR